MPVTIQAPLEIVRHYLTTANAYEQFFTQRTVLNAAEGGVLFCLWPDAHAQGTFTTVEDQRLGFTWSVDGGEAVDVTLTLEESEDGTTLTLDPADALRWPEALDNLKSRLETGIDQRQANRPLLGVLPNGPIDASYGLPIEEGILIGGTIAGTGAEDAGLAHDDVLYSINGVVLHAFSQFPIALEGKGVGDTIDVVFYRGDERHDVSFPLSSRAVMAAVIPADKAEFANFYRERMQTVVDALRGLFDEATQEAAAAPPAEGEWSAIEVLAHLIHTERWQHQFAFNRVNHTPNPAYGANDAMQVQPLAAAYPSLESALKATEAELQRTLHLIAHLPEDRRDVYLDVGQAFISSLSHVESHFNQIKTALAAARANRAAAAG